MYYKQQRLFLSMTNHLQRQKCGKFKLSSANGQTLIEFIFLLLVLMGISYVAIAGFNGAVARQWKAIVQIVAFPFDNEDDFEL